MTKMPNSVLSFAKGDLQFFEGFVDYWNHYLSMKQGRKDLVFSQFDKDGKPIDFGQKEEIINALLKKEIIKYAKVSDITHDMPVEQWAMHPSVSWATFAVVSALIDAILPQTMIDSIGAYTDVRTIGWGDSASFEIKPRDLFVVSKAGRGKRVGEVHKQFRGTVTVAPELRTLTVQVSLFKVLAGKESLADFVSKAIRSIETQMTVDAYNAFNTAMQALPSTASTGLQVSGYTQDELTRICEQVSAWNGGAIPVIAGTKRALATVLPNDANYRYDLESDYFKMGYTRSALGYDLMEMRQVADVSTPFGTVLDNDKLYVISPSTEKLVKLVLEGGTLANTSGTFENANLTQEATLMKAWGTAVATSSVAGLINIT